MISGRVQGVWFRESTRKRADETGINGWVRNLADGSVEAAFEGPAEEVARMIAWSQTGPEHALVISVQEFAEKPEGLIGFEIRE